ncbi:hypothetical protein [Engelhardtia mirabilis]|uniref:Glycosyltransferase RgtA/B/C/D-like domain-containing protein n=1 Tax=Engelhardtia mirabilis TaxID=2528011 RepID=A0A518BP57_9BACT|nr:hypothetical protein Pla133_38650 [Planctomycetes bacterium Pla133]QDV03089.1 hypothetical protein Pla86_38640 [Planctomycetes bacterium Pla86]
MSLSSRPTVIQQADRLCALGVFLVVLAVYTATFIGLPGNPDAEVEFQTTRSLALGEGFAISSETPEGTGVIALRYDVREGTGGRFYSWFGIGQALAGVPFFWAGRGISAIFPQFEARHMETQAYGLSRSEYFEHLLVGWRTPLCGALTCLLLFLIARRISVTRRMAVLAALGYGLCTFAWPQARDNLSDVQATFLLAVCVHLHLRVRESFWQFERPARWVLASLGFAAGAMVLTRVLTAPVALVLALALAWIVIAGRKRMWSNPLLGGQAGGKRAAMDMVWFAVPAALAAAVLLWANLARFGNPLESGYGAAVGSGTFFSYPPLLGLAGVTIAPGKGALWMAPALLLAPIGLWRLRDDRVVVALILAVALVVSLPVIHTQTFHGAWTYGPRYLLPAVFILWLAVAAGFDQLRAQSVHWVAPVLLMFGVVTSLPGVLVDQATHHDLALQAAREVWPAVPGDTERERDEHRFIALQWDWRFAAPWAHWRIFRHRAAGLPEEFDAGQIYFVAPGTLLRPQHDRSRGFRHLAWVDLEERLDGRVWPAVLIVLLMLGVGSVQLVRGLDPTRP